MTSPKTIPDHIGFIVDGNRRWAKSHGLPTYEGHLAGYNVMKEILIECLEQGVTYASAYVFSTENWKRDKDEVSRLMSLVLKLLKTDLDLFITHNVRLRVIGTREGLDNKLIKAIEEAEAKTIDLTGGTCVLCFNYGGQQEIAYAVQQLIKSGVAADDVTPALIEQNLYAADVPPIDLVVRTSGEQRLSNFMTWRTTYSELLFLDKPWPDMTKADVSAILKSYSERDRRFGGGK